MPEFENLSERLAKFNYEKRKKLQAENDALKALLRKNGICPYGNDGPIGCCILGVPGCGCADDMLDDDSPEMKLAIAAMEKEQEDAPMPETRI